MFKQKFFEEITFLGGVLFYLILVSYFILIKNIEFAIQLIIGLFLIYLITFIIRLFYFKERPKKQNFRSSLEKLDASSFPSIHAARATLISIFLIFNLNPVAYLILIILILAVLVFISRIYLKKHDKKDILGGVILGIICSFSLFIY